MSWPAVSSADVTGYTVTSTPGGATCSTRVTDADPTTCVIGAVAGVENTYSVVANSDAGSSAPSPASNAVTAVAPVVPATVPSTELVLDTSGQDNLDNLPPGGQITLTGSGYAPNSTVTVLVYSTPVNLGTVTTDNSGSFSVTVNVPEGLADGDHTVVSMGRGLRR